MDIVKYETEAICIFLISTYNVEGPAFQKTMDFRPWNLETVFRLVSIQIIQIGLLVCFFGTQNGSRRLDNGNQNEPVSFTTNRSGRLDNGNRNEPILGVWIMEIETNRNAGRNYDPDFGSTASPPGRDFEVYFPVAFWTEEFRRFQGTISTFRRLKERKKQKGKVKTKGEREKGKRKGKPKWRRRIFRRFDSSLDIPEFNISKVWWFLSLNVWNLTFRRFSLASTSASDI
ncbi:unnamed protein product [Rhizophagus irregularis]|nr:unnamed protein product [Rhizophagus irregularis]